MPNIVLASECAQTDLETPQSYSYFANGAVAILLRFSSYSAMIIRYKKLFLTLGALVLLGATAILSQTRQSAPDGPRLYRIWSDARGETHLEEINIATRDGRLFPVSP